MAGIQLQFTGGSRREVHKGMPVVVNAFGRGDVFKESLEVKCPNKETPRRGRVGKH